MSKSEWTFRHRGRWPVGIGELTLYALRDFSSRVPGSPFTACASVGHEGQFQVFFRRTEVERAASYCTAWLRDRDRVASFLAASTRVAGLVRSFWSTIDVPPDGPDAQLAQAYEDGNRLLTELLAYYQLSGIDMVDVGLAHVREYSQRAFDPREAMQCLLGVDTRSLESYQERVGWLRLCDARLRGEQRDRLDAALAHHADMYRHVLHGPGESGRMVDILRDRIAAVDDSSCRLLRARVRGITWTSETAEERAWMCAGRLALPHDLYRACRSVAQLSVARLAQRETLQFSYLRRTSLLKVIGERLGGRGISLPAELAAFVSNEELVDALRAQRPPDPGVLRHRKRVCVMELRDGVVQVYEGSAAERRSEELALSHADHRPAELVGTPVAGARSGIGRAQVVSTTGHGRLNATQVRGRVVVTEMIRPYMVPLLSEAAAIITEEGGVTSHAAVLAREMRVPCVVGVPAATRLLQTGTPLFVSTRTGRIYPVSLARFANLARKEQSRSPRVAPGPRTPARRVAEHVPEIVPLAGARRHGAHSVGGKAMNLADIPHLTPRGFVVTTAGTARVSPATNGAAAGFQRTLAAAVTRLGAERLAVRSSHPNEDSEDGSCAGLFRTVLDVPPQQCWTAVREVVRSAAVSNRRSRGYATPPPASPIAVIVQELVDTVVAGTACSSIRRRGRTWLVLEYVVGGSEGLSNGSLTPISSALNRDEARLTATSLVPPVPAGLFSAKLVDQLLETAVSLERERGCPQLIEWGVDAAEKLWVFQARPLLDSVDR